MTNQPCSMRFVAPASRDSSGSPPAAGKVNTTRALCPWRPNLKPCSRQPALAALIVLHVAERPSLALRDAKVEFPHVLVLCRRLRLAVHHHAAVFKDVAVARASERHAGVLFGQQE